MGSKGQGDLALDDDGGGNSAVACSICLDPVTNNRDRSWAKLQCGHQFHLDCIGSAFNVKGAMQCPNCRQVEKGQWLYANGCRSLPEISMDEWAHDDDLYDFSYSEMSYGVHWCPFGQLARLPSSFEEGDFPSAAYHDVLGQHAAFAEHTALSSSGQPCPYVAYFGPMHHPSTSSSGGSVTDASFSNPWNGPSSEVGNFSYHPMDHHFHIWDHQSPPFTANSGRVGGATDQASVAPAAPRSSRNNADVPRPGSFMHPFLIAHNHSSGTRSGSSVASALIPPYPGSNARSRDRVQALQAYYQQLQPNGGPAIQSHTVPGARRPGSVRGMAHLASVAPSPPDQSSGMYFIPTSSSSGRSFQEPENPVPTWFHSWERDHLPSISLSHVDRDPSGWAVFHPPVPSGSEPSIRPSSFRQRHGSERTPSHNRS